MILVQLLVNFPLVNVQAGTKVRVRSKSPPGSAVSSDTDLVTDHEDAGKDDGGKGLTGALRRAMAAGRLGVQKVLALSSLGGFGGLLCQH